ncbi:MAG: 50S ribosomal protein L10 [Acidimicrobiia bacterium]|nr:50S ribosomal protein L10 [Acidimicrobiia bacterium]
MATENPRPEKVAVVDEVRERLSSTEAAVLTEYRGLDVPAMAELRNAVRQAGGDYKIYKNTLVRFAAAELGLEIEDLLVGPTAIAFVAVRPDGSSGDAASLAKALRDFAKDNDDLVIKGGLLDSQPLSLDEITALADLPSRDQLFAEFAGAMESMYQDFAGLLDAKLREFAYALQEALDKQPATEAGPEEAAPADDGDSAEAVAEATDDETTDAADEGDAEAAADEATDQDQDSDQAAAEGGEGEES